MKKIRIFDTTLRDGEQTPGVHVSRAHKLEIARQLERLGTDIIEAGFPAASQGDAAAVSEIAGAVGGCTVAALARAVEGDVRTAAKALENAARPRIHVFIATSDIHLEHKLKMTREDVVRRTFEAVSLARSLCEDVEFSAEDASRSDRDFLCEVLAEAVKAGAGTLNIPDTVGYAVPEDFAGLIAYVRKHTPGIDGAVISVHCHNDLGLAAANSLAAVKAGAEQVECTVNGLGERAGNAALEEIVMSLRTRADYFGCDTGIEAVQLARTSRLVSSLYGIALPKNKAVVGENAFSHESGIHQHGMLADKRTYEIMTPESVGMGGVMVLGKLSGSHAFEERLKELGYTLGKEATDACFKEFKALADRKDVTDEDIMAIVNGYLDSLGAVYELDSFQIQSGNKVRSMAMVTLSCRGASVSEAALGDGPIDAAFNAVSRLSGADNIKLEEYNIKAVTEGADALGEATVKISVDGGRYSGRGVSTDILEASIKAYVSALNKWAGR